MCVEKECIFPLSSNPLFTPVPVMDGRVPLKDCVLSVSQFTGAERESLVELAKHLGARFWLFFSFFKLSWSLHDINFVPS